MISVTLPVVLVIAFLSGFDASNQAATEPLPGATQITERYARALGGPEAIRKHSSSTMRGTIEYRDGADVLRALFVYYDAAPYLRLERVTLPGGAGEAIGGFDGKIAWSLDPRSGPHILSGDDRESEKRDADFYYALDELTWFKSMENIAVEDFEGRPCYHLHGVNNWGKSNDHYYDRETGLLTAYEFESELGPTREIFSDYKKIDGVLVPMKQTVKARNKAGEWEVKQVITYDSVTFNDVDLKVFLPPQTVRGLAAKSN